jgi:dTDP-4-amino-4,6-dideoxygalactose transaminase
MMRVVEQELGVPRAAVIEALRAEGIPCSPGYGYSLPQQPMFRNRAFGPYLPRIADTLDYERVKCPNSDLLCHEQSLWLEQGMFLGPRQDMDDIYRAFEKIVASRAALTDWAQSASVS